MVNHAYIDESGTMDHQDVMSVAMIILEGAHSAQKLHDQVMTALHPKYIELVKQMKKDRKPSNYLPHLHFADMSDQQKRIASSRLAQAKATVFTAHHWHEGDKTHRERFEIYTELVKMCTRKAFENHRELVIGIAKQGGWQKYESNFCTVLRMLPDEFSRERVYRKANFELLSAIRPGIQLADFYVGTVRDFIIDESERLSYDLLQEQIVTRDIYTLVSAENER